MSRANGVRVAIVNSGFGVPPGRLVVNLAPADMRKTGVGFDRALALLATVSRSPTSRSSNTSPAANLLSFRCYTLRSR